eukprot:CAMPEP_0114251142 /NCGR_PEP_ID=MMETSP0058-20121206/15106_1 /TAXON_ID=36894 /ORGANISM="Pyramimonas parkeae, CCMP726" /LENGTH=314 /DNA_ID=CAMNT_0001364911 /DNA_START=404 /DNA_END=1349 /DNA_ORIENTATION=-
MNRGIIRARTFDRYRVPCEWVVEVERKLQRCTSRKPTDAPHVLLELAIVIPWAGNQPVDLPTAYHPDLHVGTSNTWQNLTPVRQAELAKATVALLSPPSTSQLPAGQTYAVCISGTFARLLQRLVALQAKPAGSLIACGLLSDVEGLAELELARVANTLRRRLQPPPCGVFKDLKPPAISELTAACLLVREAPQSTVADPTVAGATPAPVANPVAEAPANSEPDIAVFATDVIRLDDTRELRLGSISAVVTLKGWSASTWGSAARGVAVCFCLPGSIRDRLTGRKSDSDSGIEFIGFECCGSGWVVGTGLQVSA